MIFVFLLRHFCKMPAQKSWDKFRLSDYNFNTRAFRRYLAKDKEIIESSLLFGDLPDVDPDEEKLNKKKKTKRSRTTIDLTSLSETESPVRLRCKVSLCTTSEDEDEHEDEDEQEESQLSK